MKRLITDIQNAVVQAGGTWGIAIKDLDTQETWDLNGDELFYAASVIKVPIMAAVFNAFDKGEFTLSDTIILKREDLVGGAGILQFMTPGASFTIHDIMTLMIIQSDNTATNMLIDLVGIANIQKTMKDIGLKRSSFYNKLMTVPVHIAGKNLITAGEMATLLEKMAYGKVVSMYACEQMIDIMKKQQIRDCLPGKLPYNESTIIGVNPEWELANKTGWVSGSRHDIGIFYVGKRKMISAVLSKDVDDEKSQQVLAEIGKLIYDYMNLPPLSDCC